MIPLLLAFQVAQAPDTTLFPPRETVLRLYTNCDESHWPASLVDSSVPKTAEELVAGVARRQQLETGWRARFQAHGGDSLGATLAPPFSMSGYTRLRFSCSYYNNTGATVAWGVGNQEMCVYLAFSDSPYDWAGGLPDDVSPGQGTMVNGVMTFDSPGCLVISTPNDI